jgi:hypothetical protein
VFTWVDRMLRTVHTGGLMDGRHDRRADVGGRRSTYGEARSSELPTNQRLIAEIRRHRVRNARHVVYAAGALAERGISTTYPIAARTRSEPAQFWCSHTMTGRR